MTLEFCASRKHRPKAEYLTPKFLPSTNAWAFGQFVGMRDRSIDSDVGSCDIREMANSSSNVFRHVGDGDTEAKDG